MHYYAIFSLINISYVLLSSGIGNFEGLVQFKESLNRCIPWEWDEEGMTFQADDSSSVLFSFRQANDLRISRVWQCQCVLGFFRDVCLSILYELR